ncbi:serine protease [Streptomyces hilarionis]|uniref:serine protease n=1 Tax=Streptomyces hilarionis TaxID=2839954 RepID=UPI00211A3F28|nr:serine protease [Streptomyces hilarionis]MCQ9133362.1 serine protease [Streptomyces hilarionis]
MAGRGPRAPWHDCGRDAPQDGQADASRAAPDSGPHLVRIRDLDGRPRGAGFVADHHGTVITSHEAVDGLPGLVLHTDGDRTCVVTADAVTALPELDLALVRTEGLGADPLPVTVRQGVESGRYVRVAAGCWREARVLAETTATYTATDRPHLLDRALELAIGTAGRDALRPGGGAAGGPVLDARTGAVVAVLGTALRCGHRDTGFAVPLRPRTGTNRDQQGEHHGESATASPTGSTSTTTGTAPAAGRATGEFPAPTEEAHSSDGAGIPGEAMAADGVAIPEDGDGAAVDGVRMRATPSPTAPTGRTAAAAGALPTAGAAQASGDAGARATGPAGATAAPGGAGGAGGAGDRGRPATAGHAGTAEGPGPTGISPDAEATRAWAEGPLGELLARNAATVPAYGADLNLAGVLELTATSVGSDGPPGALHHTPDRTGRGSRTAASVPVERALVVEEFARFAASPAAVLGLVGAPGSGRTTELAALAARRSRGSRPAPTLWLRGADLHDEDESLADAARRTLARAARIVAASRPGWAATPSPAAGPTGADLGDVTPERLARLARTVGRPLLLLLDGPEEMPPVLAHRLTEWTDGTARWLRETGARLVVACRNEYWEHAGALFPPGTLYGAAAPGDPLPPCVRLGDFTPDEAREARARHCLPEGALAAPDDRHPLTLRLLGEVRAALPGGPPDQVPVDRDDVLSAHLDLMCLRVAVRLAAANGLRGTAVRRLAAKVSGQVHDAARRSLGPGQGGLDRASFEAVFPWGPAPARLGGGTGWASAVLAEGLLVPAGDGYRFAHEELADWIQGAHLDLDEALRALVHRPDAPAEDGRPLPVPHHRIGPVVEALLLLACQQGPHRLAAQLRELTHALEADPDSWWAARLLTGTLLRVPDATPYTAVLRLIADRIGAGATDAARCADLGPAFWTRLALPSDARLDLLRRLVLADGAPHDADAPRYLDAVAGLLAAAPTAVQPHLTHWFDDERPLPATPHATVATAAQALLHTHRHRAPDDLTEALADCAHPRADELLAVLAEEEPSALCRAVDRWAHDARPARRSAAMTHGARVAPHVRTGHDRLLLRRAARALLARPADRTLHGGALALLVRDPETRAHHLAQALERFAAGDPRLPPDALLTALDTHPEPVLHAVRTRLLGRGRPAPDGTDSPTPADDGGTNTAWTDGDGPEGTERERGRADGDGVLVALVEATPPALAPRIAALVREALERRPESAGRLAASVGRRLDDGPTAYSALLPLVRGLLDADCPERARAALGGVLAAPGAPPSAPLRRELLDHLLTHERAPAVLTAVLYGCAGRAGEDLRALVHRTGLLLVRTPDGATRFDRGLVDLGRHVPGFAAQAVDWLVRAPGEWDALVGPGARRTLESLAGARVPA